MKPPKREAFFAVRTRQQKTPTKQVGDFYHAVRTRLELVTPCVTGTYSNQLN